MTPAAHLGFASVVGRSKVLARNAWCQRIILLAALGLVLSRAALGEEGEWKWFCATSYADGWWIQKGVASVHLTQNDFSATLYVDDRVWYHISGRRKGNDLTVKLTREASDLVDYPLSGKIKHRQWKGATSIGRETIALSDGDVTVGLVREIDR